MAYTVEIKTFKDFDLSIFGFPQIAVFDKPEDYPDKTVARVLDNGKATNVIMLAENPDEIREDIRKYTNLMWCPRGKEDVQALVGVYW